MVGNSEIAGEEVEDRSEIGSDVGGEDGGAHAEDSAEIVEVDALGLEEGDDGVDGAEGGGVESGVEGERSAGVDAHDLEAEDFLLELEGDVGVGGLVERVFLEESFGFEEDVVLIGIGRWYWGAHGR